MKAVEKTILSPTKFQRDERLAKIIPEPEPTARKAVKEEIKAPVKKKRVVKKVIANRNAYSLVKSNGVMSQGHYTISYIS